MDTTKLKEANDLFNQMDATKKTIQTISTAMNLGRMIGVTRKAANGPVEIETANSVYRIEECLDVDFPEDLYKEIRQAVVNYRQKLTEQLEGMEKKFAEL